MQDGSWTQPLPSLLQKDHAGGGALDQDGGVFSEASSDGDLYLDPTCQLDAGDEDFADLTAFLSADEINLSLDLAREAFGEEPGTPASPKPTQEEPFSIPIPPPDQQTKAFPPDSSAMASPGQNVLFGRTIQTSSETSQASAERFVCHRSVAPVYKQDGPRLLHQGLELSDRVSSATEFCSRAATFIEELSSLFKGAPGRPEQPAGEEDSSSPDSGYLSPRSQRVPPVGAVSVLPPPPRPAAATGAGAGGGTQQQQQQGPPGPAGPAAYQNSEGGRSQTGPLSPPVFSQKLKSQEVAEGSPIQLECRVGGNPLPLVR
ncbi:unnamed protein product [Merluccius merluccius]